MMVLGSVFLDPRYISSLSPITRISSTTHESSDSVAYSLSHCVRSVRAEEQKRERLSERGGYAAVPPPTETEQSASSVAASSSSNSNSASSSSAAPSSQAGDRDAVQLQSDSQSSPTDANGSSARTVASSPANEDAELARLLDDTPFKCPVDLQIPPEITTVRSYWNAHTHQYQYT